MEAALRAVYEVGYYHVQLTGLVITLAAALKGRSDELEKIDGSLSTNIESVEEQTREAIGVCLDLEAEYVEAAFGKGKPFDSRGT